MEMRSRDTSPTKGLLSRGGEFLPLYYPAALSMLM